MHKITYLVNGDRTTNDIHCSITHETEHYYTISIGYDGYEIERKIRKSKITKITKLQNHDNQ